MAYQNLKRLLALGAVAIAVGLSVGAPAQAEEAGKPAKAQVKKGKKPVAKKAEPAESKSSCDHNGKKWRNGEHCTKSCNEKETSCDMQICKEGEWKPYSSCFGKSAVSPNCPPACS